MKLEIKKQLISAVLSISIFISAISPTLAAGTSVANPQQIQSMIPTQTKQAVKHDVQPESFKTKIVARALRYATWFVRYIEPYVGKSTADWLRKNLGRLADFLETLDNLQELPIVYFLVSNGIPPADAQVIAHYIVLVFGL